MSLLLILDIVMSFEHNLNASMDLLLNKRVYKTLKHNSPFLELGTHYSLYSSYFFRIEKINPIVLNHF